MAALDLTSFDSALKVHYTDQRVKNMVYKKNPALAMIPKMETFGGKNLPIPIQYGVTQGRSATFTKAQENKVASKFEDFVITRIKDYSLASVDNETLEASIGDVNSFLTAATTELDSAIHSATRSLATAMFRNGTGSIGQISTATAPTTAIILENTEEIVNFEVGMELVASDADGGALGSADIVTITAVNRSTGTLTVTPDAGAIAGHNWAVGDFMYQEGDAENAGTALKLSGFDAWLPSTAPTSTAFFGVDRSVDTDRLGGIRYDGSSETVEEALISAASRGGREGAMLDVCFLNHQHWAELVKSLGAKVEYSRLGASDAAEISFRSVVLATATGDIQVVADHNCPAGVAYMLTMSTWKLYSIGPAPKILNKGDGLTWLRESAADAVEVRCGYYAQMGCTAPGWNVRVALAT